MDSVQDCNSVQWTVYNGQCTMDSVQWTVYNGQCTMDSVQWTVYNGQCMMDSVQHCNSVLGQVQHMRAGLTLAWRWTIVN